MKKQLVCTKEVREAARVLRAVNHELRGGIISLLDRNEKMTVTEIYTALDIPQTICSGHLGILLEAKVVAMERTGKYKNYFLDRARLQEINDFSKALTRVAT